MMKRFLQSLVLLICFVANQNIAHADTDRDVSAGKDIYNRCIACHSPEYHRTGPLHCRLLGRKAGSITGFEFTAAMKESAIVWTKETLDQFLTAPFDMIPGTSMGFAGIASSKERQQLITYLAMLTAENPLCR